METGQRRNWFSIVCDGSQNEQLPTDCELNCQ